MRNRLSWVSVVVVFALVAEAISAQPVDSNSGPDRHPPLWDVVVYGGTSAGIVAAVQAKRMGRSVVLLGPDARLGGLTSGGLGWTDTGNKGVIGGLAREFYHRIWQKYQEPENWKWQSRDEYGNQGQGTPAIDGQRRTMWIFEPHIAEEVFEDWIKQEGITCLRNEYLDRDSGVRVDDRRIRSIRTLSGRTFRGKTFIDATYEGDLMAAAGVSYHVGRESRDTYQEQWNGSQTGVLHHRHHFGVLKQGVDPYHTPGDPASGLLPRISPDPPGKFGAADHRIQAYCFRMCLTQVAENRVPFVKPDGYDSRQYALLLRILEAGWRETFRKFDPIPNRKTDTNNHGPFSTDNIGFNYDYPEASYERRREIVREHETYQRGLMYFLANDPRVPEDVRMEMSRWGLAKDEFQDNDNWPTQLYVREARRMVGQFVMTENELLKKRPTPHSIGMGSYTMDSHNVQRYVTQEGFVQNEGDIGVSTRGPYQIALGSILPKEQECQNLLVPVCVSSSHIAFGSIRMEPVFMILGQSAATLAALSIEQNCAVQEVPYPVLRAKLLQDQQVLDYETRIPDSPKSVSAQELEGTVVDDRQAQATGVWNGSRSLGKFVGDGYQHDGHRADGRSVMIFPIRVQETGVYQVNLAYTASENRATNVPVRVKHAGGQEELTVNQRRKPEISGLFHKLGEFKFRQGEDAFVQLSNRATNGHVIADAIQLIPLPPCDF